jgi:CubicO group peptidase (beta-lactamase class C family)
MNGDALGFIHAGAMALNWGLTSPVLGALTVGSLLALSSCLFAVQPVARFPGKSWERKTPAEVGLDEAKLQEFISSLKMLAENRRAGPTKENPESYGVVIKDGYLAASWGEPSRKFDWQSSSKPVLSTLLFYAIQEGKLKGIDDRIADWGRELSEKDRPMTFAHLANMISGYTLKEPPGAAWAYNDFAIHLYALTLDRVFGGKRLNVPASDLFKDLHLEDGDVFGEAHKGYGVVTSPRDFARIGWLWMHRGNWNGKQVLRREFFDKYMKPTVPPALPRSSDKETNDYLRIESYGGGNNQNDYGPGLYGFCWWFNAPLPATGQLNWPHAPMDTFATLGFGGKNMVMIPSRNLLVAAHGYWGKANAEDADSRFNQNLKLLLEAVK